MTFGGDFKANEVDHLNLSGELMRLLNESDLNVLNFEAPATTSRRTIRKSGPNIRQHIEAPAWVESHAFNAVSLANNHIMDFGEEGLDDTLRSFKKSDTMGVGTWDEAYKPHTFTLGDGTRVAITCCTHKEFGTLTDRWSESKFRGAAHTLNADIQRFMKWGGGKRRYKYRYVSRRSRIHGSAAA